MKHQTAIVIGASSGIGREIVIQLARQGVRVAAVARRADKLAELRAVSPDNILTFELDATKPEGAKESFLEICKQLGGLDLFVYSAGVMPAIEPREFNLAKDTQMIEVNITGAVIWCNLAAERFMNAGHGTLVGLGSVAGDRGRHGYPVYNASKAFLHTYFEALRNRLTRYGCNVVTIKPGPVETEMTQHLSIKKMPVETATRVILSKLGKNGEFYLTPVHRIAFYIIKRIPSPLFRKLKI